MGNLALPSGRAKGNWPRSPLFIAEVQEEPFALKRETIFAVDERGYNDGPTVQMSNFDFYQDRETGDVVIFLTRYGEKNEREWKSGRLLPLPRGDAMICWPSNESFLAAAAHYRDSIGTTLIRRTQLARRRGDFPTDCR